MKLYDKVKNRPGVVLEEAVVNGRLFDDFTKQFILTLAKKFKVRKSIFAVCCFLLLFCLCSSAFQFGLRPNTATMLMCVSLVWLVVICHSAYLDSVIERAKKGEYPMDAVNVACTYNSISFSMPIPWDKISHDAPFNDEELNKYRLELLESADKHNFIVIKYIGYYFCLPDLGSEYYMMRPEDSFEEALSRFEVELIKSMDEFIEMLDAARGAYKSMEDSFVTKAMNIEAAYAEYSECVDNIPEEIRSRVDKIRKFSSQDFVKDRITEHKED